MKTGKTVTRGTAHRTGAWHGAFHCLIIGERDGRVYAIFQKRSRTKRIAPGKFDVSAGGHYACGENAAEAGPREIREELGLTVSFNELVSLGRRVFVHCFTAGIKEQEFQDVFFLPQNIRPGDLALQQEELDGVVEMDVQQGIALFAGRTSRVATVLYGADQRPKPVRISSGDFVPSLDNYYLKLLLLARRYFSGERELLII